MTNSVALTFIALIIALLLADAYFLGWGIPVLAMEQLARLTRWLAFWR